MLFSELIQILKKGNANLLDHSIGNDPEIIKGESLERAGLKSISFLENNSPLTSELISTHASAVLLPNNDKLIDIANTKGIPWAVLKDPRLAFAETLKAIKPERDRSPGIHSSAVMDKNVTIGNGTYIGPHVSIGENCKIGDQCIIHPGVIIYEDVYIGDKCELHANCVIHREVTLGNNCVIHSTAVIGSEGFGFVPSQNGWEKMPQTGVVIIENEVEIGCGSTVDRPAVGETVIGRGTKIDNLVQIGHGVRTGKGCAMAAQVGIAGGATIGNGVILAGQVGVGNRVKVGNNVIASSKCGIHTDIEPGQVISGFPAMPNKLWLRCSANFKRLPEIAKSIRELVRK